MSLGQVGTLWTQILYYPYFLVTTYARAEDVYIESASKVSLPVPNEYGAV